MKAHWLVWIFISVLAACGGGDGDGEQASVSFAPEKVLLTYESGSSKAFSVTATVTNPDAFAGSDLVVARLEDEKGVITLEVGLTQPEQGIYTFTLHTSPSLAPGRHEGKLLLKLCPDMECRSQFPGSPFLLPYEFTVLPAAN